MFVIPSCINVHFRGFAITLISRHDDLIIKSLELNLTVFSLFTISGNKKYFLLNYAVYKYFTQLLLTTTILLNTLSAMITKRPPTTDWD